MKEISLQPESISPDQAREFIVKNREGTFTLLDVRQPSEYRSGHIPGSILIPLPELDDRASELDPLKPAIVYCASGGRSRVAAQSLLPKGFGKVYNLTGGFKAWKGYKAYGSLDQGFAFFASANSPREFFAVVYSMEEALETFYKTLASSREAETQALLDRLAAVEETHKRKVLETYFSVEEGYREGALSDGFQKLHVMEGGVSMEEALREKQADLLSSADILAYALMLEAQALDLYSRASRSYSDNRIRSALEGLVDDEKAHLLMLERLLEKHT